MSAPDVKPGDQVSWQWGGGAPGGTASEVKPDEVKMTTARGNEVTKKGDEENPAVRVERSGHDVVKKANELDIEEEGPEHKGGESGGDKPDGETETNENGEKKETKGLQVPKGKGKGRGKSTSPAPPVKAKAGKAEKPAEDGEKEDNPKEDKGKENGEKKDEKKRGRPGRKPGSKNATTGAAAAKKDKPKKRAATESGEPRRSKRTRT